MAEFITLKVDPDGRLKNAVQKAIEAVGDLSIPLRAITRSWYKSNRAIFNLSGPGKYTDLSGTLEYGYKKRKRAEVGFVYPILKKTGRLESSLVQASSRDAIALLVGKTALLLGSATPYGIYHQSGQARSKMPFRPFIFLGAEQTAPDQLHNRRETWIKILTDHVEQVSRKAIQS